MQLTSMLSELVAQAFPHAKPVQLHGLEGKARLSLQASAS